MTKNNVFVAYFVALPDVVKAGLTAVVLYLVSVLFANLILLLPFLAFLEQFREPLAQSLAIAFIAWLQNILPDAYPQVAVLAIELLLAVLAIFGIGATLAAMGALPALLSL